MLDMLHARRHEHRRRVRDRLLDRAMGPRVDGQADAAGRLSPSAPPRGEIHADPHWHTPASDPAKDVPVAHAAAV